MTINQMIKERECPNCGQNRLVSVAIDSDHFDTVGILNRDLNAIDSGNGHMFVCDNCSLYIIFINERIYLYSDGEWNLLFETKEVVVFS